MDKLKNIISPGHNADDQKLYGTEGSTASPSSTATQQHVSPHTGTATGHANDLDETAANARALPGSTHMPGSFATPQDESARSLGTHPSTTGTTNPSSAATGALGSTAGTTSARQNDTPIAGTHTSHPSGAAGTGIGSTGTSSALPGADDRASTTSIKSGIPGNTSSTHPTTGAPTGGMGGSTSDPYASSATGTSNPLSSTGTGAGTTSGRIQDPPFSNRTLHQSSQPGTSSTSGLGRDALAGAGVGAAGYEAEKHHGHHGHHGTSGLTGTPGTTGTTGTGATGTHGLSSATQPSTGLGSTTGSSHPSTLGGTTGSHGTTGTHGLGSTTQPSTGLGSTAGTSHPSTLGGTTGSHGVTGTSGATGTTSQLADRTVPHADIGGTTTERSFPLGGHAGEGPHAISTANRLDPRVPDTAAEFRQGTHHHGQQTGSGITGTAAGLGAGALAGEEASRHHHGHGHHGQTDPSSGITGTSATRTGAPSGVGKSTTDPTTSTHGTHGTHHLGRDAAAGTGAAGLGAAGAHELDRSRGTGGIGSTGASTGTGPTTTSGGIGQPSGHKYNTLSDGTPSGISTQDPAHPSSGSGVLGNQPTSHLGRDAALGAGAAGVGSGAAYEAGKHHTGPTATSGGYPTSTGQQYNALGDGTPSGIAASDPAHPQHSAGSTTGSSGHHLGRDVGAGAAGAGATGLAAHEYEKHRNQPASGLGNTGGQSVTQHAPVPGSSLPTAVHGTNDPSHPTGTAAARAQDSLSNYPDRSTGHQSHLGRDAAVATGAGGAGTAAAYEAEKHKPGTSTTDPTHHSHTGRDAAAATGAGGAGTAAAYEAEKHKHGHEEKKPGLLDRILHRDPAEKEAKKEEKELQKEEKQAEKEAKKEEKHADKAVKKDDSKHQHHRGEEATFAGAGAGAVGVTAEEGYRHDDPHGNHRTANMPGSGVHGQQPLHDGRVPTTGTTGSTVPTGGTDATPIPSSHYHGRDAGLAGAGATGAGGAAYAGDKYAHPTSGTHHPSSTTGYSQGAPTTSASAQGIDPRVDSPQYGSTTSGTGYGTGATGTSAAGTHNAPATTGEKQGGALHNLLHRDNPNKLHKDPPTSGN